MLSRRLLAGIVVAIGILSVPADRVAFAQNDLYAAWERVLANYVDSEGLIDYAGLEARGMDDLSEFMRLLAETDPAGLGGRQEQLAFWINAYNAVVIWQVVEKYPIDSVRDVGALWGLVGGFFKNEFRIAGQDMSADNIEHDTLRARFDEDRIHWALVCGAFGCPRLLDRPYRAATLEETLAAQSREFLGQPRGLQLDREANTLYLSSYFKWYEDDFTAAAGTVINYVLRHAPDDVAEYVRANRDDLRVQIMDYDWTLNEQSRGPRSRRPGAR
jgi:hypothetical protein